jgi:hypothetical protein
MKFHPHQTLLNLYYVLSRCLRYFENASTLFRKNNFRCNTFLAYPDEQGNVYFAFLTHFRFGFTPSKLFLAKISLDSCVGRFFIQIFFWILVKKCPTPVYKFGFACQAFFHTNLFLDSRVKMPNIGL